MRPVLLNLGAGLNPLPKPFINVDAYGTPDVRWDLNVTPYPWEDNSVDGIEMWHVLEHLDDWWAVFCECARILKVGGYLHIRVPDESSKTALTYRDHNHVFSLASFHGIAGRTSGTNAWAITEEGKVPLALVEYYQVPYTDYQWMIKWCPRILKFCADHLRNFIHEQRFIFRKIGDR